MKGLVLAGGSGTRLRPLTYTGAKQLVPVANRPILFYVIDNLVGAGIRDIGVIISPQTGDEVRTALDSENAQGVWQARFTYLPQERPLGLAHAVFTARPFLGDDDFCMFLGDNLIGTRIDEAVSTFMQSPGFDASVMLKQVPNPSSFGVAEVDDQGNVTRLVEKPKEPRSDLALVGIYLFRPSIFDAIARIQPSPRGELEITDAIAMLLTMGKRVRFERVTSWWLDTGKKDDLLLANDTVLDDWMTARIDGSVDTESRISGRVQIGKGARVERSVIRGPAIIGPGSHIVDARIGPFTSIGTDCTVARSSVDHSVLMDGSRIEDVHRLEDSLIGRRVVVHPGGTHHGALSLLVGDDCRIELAKSLPAAPVSCGPALRDRPDGLSSSASPPGVRCGIGAAMKRLIFGAGFLGHRLERALPGAVLVKADITDARAVEAALREHRPDAVINAAGKTGRPNVDWCESHPIETARVNVNGAITLAEQCGAAGVYLLHLGSGCIFYGDSPSPEGWREDDFANPTSLYSRTKYAADLVLSRLPNVAIARLRMPIDDHVDNRNLITKLSRYTQVVDVANSVTIVEDLVRVVTGLTEQRLEGVFHATNPGVMRHRDLLALYTELVDPNHRYELIDEEALVGRGLAVKARSNCILASGRLAAAGLAMRPIDEALRDCMTRYARAVRG